VPASPRSIIFLHGFASSYDHGWVQSGWTDILADVNVQIPPLDLPGHGTRGEQWQPEDFDDIESSVFASLPGPTPHWAVGFSAGAQLLLRMAIAHPEAFSRIVLMGISDRIFATQSTDEMIAGLEATDDSEDIQLQVFRRLAATTGNDVDALVRFLRAPNPALSIEDVAKVSCPVLVIVGERDDEPPVSLVDALPDARLLILPGVDHFATPSDFGAIDATMRFFDLG